MSENKSFKEVLFAIADAFGKKRPSKKIHVWQTAVFWRFSWIVSKITSKEPLLSKYSAKSAHHISYYSSEKLLKTIDFQFEKVENAIHEITKTFPQK